MLIYTYLVTVETTLRRYAALYSFQSRADAAAFEQELKKRFGGLQPRLIFKTINYVAGVNESLEIFEREMTHEKS